MKELYIDVPAKWKTRDSCQKDIGTDESPVGMGR